MLEDGSKIVVIPDRSTRMLGGESAVLILGGEADWISSFSTFLYHVVKPLLLKINRRMSCEIYSLAVSCFDSSNLASHMENRSSSTLSYKQTGAYPIVLAVAIILR
jgi:hypothetical protein